MSSRREIGRLLSNKLSNVRLKLEISNVKIGLKNAYNKTWGVTFGARCKLEIYLWCKLEVAVAAFVA